MKQQGKALIREPFTLHWSKRFCWLAVASLAVFLIILDFFTGPLIHFPITFVLPVCLAGWFLGSRPAIGWGVFCVVARLAMVWTWGHPLYSVTVSLTNALIQLFVLTGIGLLVHVVAEQQQRLTQRVDTLEGLLPICSFCKKIRNQDGSWEPIEQYVSARSDTVFSHGLCEPCARKHYPDLFNGPEKSVS